MQRLKMSSGASRATSGGVVGHSSSAESSTAENATKHDECLLQVSCFS